MKRENVKKYLRMLGVELQRMHITGEVLVADGFIMLLEIINGAASKEVSGYFKGEGEAIYEAMDIIAKREGLPEDWLSKGLKSYFIELPPREKWIEYPGVRIYLTTLEYLLAMKTATAYSQRDVKEIRKIAQKLQISKAKDVLTPITRYVPEQLISPQMVLAIEQAFQA
ncbi:MAG: hypothetical protein ACRDIV_11185 [Ktedonobacteraceae bacterium]